MFRTTVVRVSLNPTTTTHSFQSVYRLENSIRFSSKKKKLPVFNVYFLTLSTVHRRRRSTRFSGTIPKKKKHYDDKL